MNTRQHWAAWSAVVLLTAASSGCGTSSFAEPVVDPAVVTAMRISDAGGGGAGGPGGGGTGWGTLKGQFTYNGTPPVMGVQPGFDPNKDPNCKPPAKDQSLLVDGSTKGIKNILVYLVTESRIHPDLEAVEKQDVVFDQKGCVFLSPITALRVKDNLAILNSDNTAHNTSGDPGRGNPLFNQLLTPGGRFDYKFVAPINAPTPVTCAIHPWMRAYVIARSDPYFAITAADGTFEIPKLPAGEELEFQVWHEKQSGDGLRAKPEWSARGRFKVTIAKDGESVDVTAAVDPSAFQ